MHFITDREEIIRRDFVKLCTGIVGGLGISGLLIRSADANDLVAGNALDDSYLERGLNALARAHNMSSMAGHLGASLIAGYFIGKQRPKLDPEVFNGIKDDLRRVMGGKSVFGKKMSKQSKLTDAQLFEAFPQQKPDGSLIDGIAESLEKGIDQPRQSRSTRLRRVGSTSDPITSPSPSPLAESPECRG